MSIPWLKELEERVAAATERLRELRSENDTLKSRVAELEAELAARGDGGDGDGDANNAWREEREEIRGRVEKLAGELEALLEE